MTDKTPFANIETPRLVLRRFADADLATFLAYANDPLVSRYQSWESYTEAEARDLIGRQKTAEPGRPGWFSFAVELKETGVMVGHVSLSAKAEDVRQGEMGFAFAREYQGRGLAREAAERVLAYAFEALGMHRVVGVTDCENVRSVALLERLGMRREAHFVENIWFKGAWGSEFYYAILRSEWAAGRSA
jgi:RimJ/RimL family protein N-acetyltransferase